MNLALNNGGNPMEKKRKMLNILLTTLFLVTPLVVVSLIFKANFSRLFVSLKTFITHLGYFFSYDFLKDKTPPHSTFDQLLSNGYYDFALPFDQEVFKARLGVAFSLLINGDIFSGYWKDASNVLYVLGRLLTFVVILILVVTLLSKLSTFDPQSKLEDTKSLTRFKRFELKASNLLLRVQDKWYELPTRMIKTVYLVLFLFATGLLPIVLDIASEALLILSGGHFERFFSFLIVLLSDLVIYFIKVPIIITVFFGWILFDKLRIRLAKRKLESLCASNDEFYASTGNIIAIVGASGTGKTSLLVDAVLSLEEDLRNNKLLKIMHRKEALFPTFPWRKLEESIDRFSSLKKDQQWRIYSRQSIYEFVYKNFQKERPFGYSGDFVAYDGLKLESLMNAVYCYAVAYFYYRIEGALSYTTTPISHSSHMVVDHYFPLYGASYFNFEPDFDEERSYSMILDFDTLRLGEKMNPKTSYLLDCGIWAIPEVGKERGSTFDLRSKSQNDESCNIASDFFYTYLTIERHNAELDYEVLFKGILDDQDMMKLNSDTRQLVESLITLDRMNSIKGKNALWLFWLDSMLCDLVTSTFHRTYDVRKAKKKNDTTFWYLFRKISSAFERYKMRRSNHFGYDKLAFYCSNASLDDVTKVNGQGYLYLCYAKVYSNRFNDVYLQSLFDTIEKNSNESILDQARYTSLSPSVADFKRQHSFMYNDYFSVFATGKKKK